MSINNAKDDFEKYRLTVQVRDESTLQLIPNVTTGVDTWQTWRRRRHLGQGAFGEVWQEGTEDQYGDWHYRAVKVCSERKMQAAQIDYKRELSALAAFSKSAYSSWFVHLHGWWMQSGTIFFAMEYLPYGALSRYTTSALLEVSIKEIAEDTLQGLKVMHKEGFTHRDIKPENILVVQKRPESPRWWVKIADFGISKRILEESESALHTTVGTRSYCAPEILGHIKQFEETSFYSSKVDMWSLGCVLFNVSSQGQVPFSESDLVRYCDGLVPFNPSNAPIRLSDDGEAFVKALLKVEPEQRPTASEALRHPWLTMTGVAASNNTAALPAASHGIKQQNFNSFLDSTLSISSFSLITDRTGSTMSSVTTPSIEAVSEARDATQSISVSTRNSPDDAFTETYHGVQSLPIRLTHTETIPLSDEISGLPTEAVPGARPDTVMSARAKPVVSKAESNLSAYYNTGQERLRSESLGTIKEREVHKQDTEDDPAPLATTSDEYLEPMVWLREQGVNIHGKDDRFVALRLAVQEGQLKVIMWLREQGVDLHAKQEDSTTAIYAAAEYGHLEVVKYLRGQGANIHEKNTEGSTAIHTAIWGGHLEVVKYLKGQGANIHEKNINGDTAIHFAAAQGQVKVVEYLGEQGISISEKNNFGRTAMHNAAFWGHLAVVEYLREHGANTNEQDVLGDTPLHLAAWQGDLETVEYLLGHGANTNEQNNRGMTPLYLAAMAGHLEMVKWLREHGDWKDKQFTKCINRAEQEGHLEVAKYLREQRTVVRTASASGRLKIMFGR